MPQRVGFLLDIEARKETLDRLGKIDVRLKDINKELSAARKLGKDGVYASLKQQQRELRQEARDLNKELKQQTLTLGDLVDNFRIGFVRVGDFKAGLANTQKIVGITTKAIKANTLATKAWKIAVVSFLGATGVGLLIVALGSLVAWLTSTQEGINLVNRAFAALKGGITEVVSTLARFFKEGFSAFDGFGERIEESTVGVFNTTKALQDLTEERQRLDLLTTETLNKEKQLAKIAEDTSKSDAERAKAAQEAIKLEQDLRQQLVAFKQKEIALEQKLLDAKGETALDEDRQRLVDLRKELQEIETASFERETTLNNKLNVSNQALAKSLDEVKKAAEGSIAALTEKLGKLNEEVQSGALTGSALFNKIKEIVALEDEIKSLNKAIEETANKARFGLRPQNLGPGLQTLDGTGGGVTGAPDTLVQEQRDRELEKEKEHQDNLLAIKMDALDTEKAMREEAYSALAAISAEFATGEIKTIGDFAKKSLELIVDSLVAQLRARLAAAKAAALLNPNPLAKARALSGIVAGEVAISALSALVKSSISKLEAGGVTNPGFVAKGARHAHGGIKLGNGQEIEGGEPVLTRRAAHLFPEAINAINQASGGRRILRDGGILAGGSSSVPLLPSQFFAQSTGLDSREMAERVEAAVSRGIAKGLLAGNRRIEREQEFEQRSIA